MDHTNVDVKSLRTLEELQFYLGTTLVSIRTMVALQAQAISAGIMPEDMNVRAADIIQQLKVCFQKIQEQALENADLLPPDYNPEKIAKKLKKQEVELARAFLKKARVKE